MLYLTLRQMEYVVAVARAGSLSAAAEALSVSQPSLSVALSQVEAHLGESLFLRRQGSPITPTPFGERYVAEAAELLALARRLADPALARAAARGRLTLGVFQDLAPRLLAPVLAHLRQSLPGLKLDYRIGDFETLAREMRAGRVDLSITYDLCLDAGFHRRQLEMAVPHTLLAAGHDLAARPSLGLADLAAAPLILSDEGLSVRHMLRLFRGIGVVPRVAHRVRALEVMRSLAGSGEGIGISYTVPSGEHSYDGRPVRALPITDPAAREPVLLASPAALPEAGEVIARLFSVGDSGRSDVNSAENSPEPV